MLTRFDTGNVNSTGFIIVCFVIMWQQERTAHLCANGRATDVFRSLYKQTSDLFRWQNIISTCAVYTFRLGDESQNNIYTVVNVLNIYSH